MQGTASDLHFVNPHCVVEFDRQGRPGPCSKMEVEFANARGAIAQRLDDAASLEAGDKVTLTGHPAKDGTRAIHVNENPHATGKEAGVAIAGISSRTPLRRGNVNLKDQSLALAGTLPDAYSGASSVYGNTSGRLEFRQIYIPPERLPRNCRRWKMSCPRESS